MRLHKREKISYDYINTLKILHPKGLYLVLCYLSGLGIKQNMSINKFQPVTARKPHTITSHSHSTSTNLNCHSPTRRNLTLPKFRPIFFVWPIFLRIYEAKYPWKDVHAKSFPISTQEVQISQQPRCVETSRCLEDQRFP